TAAAMIGAFSLQPRQIRFKIEREIDVGGFVRSLCSDSNNLVVYPPENDLFSDRIGICVEPAPPQMFAENRHRRCIRSIGLWTKSCAYEHRSSQGPKIVPSNKCAAELGNISSSRQNQIFVTSDSKVDKRTLGRTEIQVVGITDVKCLEVAQRLKNFDQPIRTRVR